tara:strand:- start:748 stop:1065 length:318 start_codon:yes stop_codon:yes gene_type:complete
MMMLKNLRLALEVSKSEVQASTLIAPERLRLIEDGAVSVPHTLSDFYASRLKIDKGLMRVLLLGSERKVPFFEGVRAFALKFLNGYLKLSLWMSAIDENSKTIPH